ILRHLLGQPAVAHHPQRDGEHHPLVLLHQPPKLARLAPHALSLPPYTQEQPVPNAKSPLFSKIFVPPSTACRMPYLAVAGCPMSLALGDMGSQDTPGAPYLAAASSPPDVGLQNARVLIPGGSRVAHVPRTLGHGFAGYSGCPISGGSSIAA